jgi:hypothetical protein
MWFVLITVFFVCFECDVESTKFVVVYFGSSIMDICCRLLCFLWPLLKIHWTYANIKVLSLQYNIFLNFFQQENNSYILFYYWFIYCLFFLFFSLYVLFISDSSPNRYLVVIKFRDQMSADQFYLEHNGKRFNSLGVKFTSITSFISFIWLCLKISNFCWRLWNWKGGFLF